MTDRRAQIIRAAREIAASKGLSSVSVRSVAAHAGIGASTLRHYFRTQRELYEAILDPELGEFLHDLRIADARIPAKERLTECLMQFLTSADDRQSSLEQWLAAITTMAGPEATEQQRTFMAATLRTANRRVVGWLNLLAAEGVMRDGDRERQMQLLTSVVDGVAISLLLPGSGIDDQQARELVEDAVDAVLR